MSLWTDFRNNVENQVGIGPNSNTAQTLADATIGASRSVGSLISSPPAASPAALAATAPLSQKVQAFVSGSSKTLLIAGVGILAVVLFMRKRR